MAKSQAFVELMDIITPVVREGGAYDKIVGLLRPNSVTMAI